MKLPNIGGLINILLCKIVMLYKTNYTVLKLDTKKKKSLKK